MVKFGQKLEDQQRAEWAEGYVNYKSLKKLLVELRNRTVGHERHQTSIPASVQSEPITMMCDSQHGPVPLEDKRVGPHIILTTVRYAFPDDIV